MSDLPVFRFTLGRIDSDGSRSAPVGAIELYPQTGNAFWAPGDAPMRPEIREKLMTYVEDWAYNRCNTRARLTRCGVARAGWFVAPDEATKAFYFAYDTVEDWCAEEDRAEYARMLLALRESLPALDIEGHVYEGGFLLTHDTDEADWGRWHLYRELAGWTCQSELDEGNDPICRQASVADVTERLRAELRAG